MSPLVNSLIHSRTIFSSNSARRCSVVVGCGASVAKMVLITSTGFSLASWMTLSSISDCGTDPDAGTSLAWNLRESRFDDLFQKDNWVATALRTGDVTDCSEDVVDWGEAERAISKFLWIGVMGFTWGLEENCTCGEGVAELSTASDSSFGSTSWHVTTCGRREERVKALFEEDIVWIVDFASSSRRGIAATLLIP